MHAYYRPWLQLQLRLMAKSSPCKWSVCVAGPDARAGATAAWPLLLIPSRGFHPLQLASVGMQVTQATPYLPPCSRMLCCQLGSGLNSYARRQAAAKGRDLYTDLRGCQPRSVRAWQWGPCSCCPAAFLSPAAVSMQPQHCSHPLQRRKMSVSMALMAVCTPDLPCCLD